MNLTLDEPKVKLVRRVACSEVISLCARMRTTDNSFINICHKYDVHCEMSDNISSVTKL